MEACESGLIGQFRKLLYWKQYRRFESSRFRKRFCARGAPALGGKSSPLPPSSRLAGLRSDEVRQILLYIT